MIEHRLSPEFRVQGRTLSGIAMRYGDTSPDFRERFVPGAFGELPTTVSVNLQHDPSVIVAPNAILSDSPRALNVRADLPERSAALALVRRGALSGFSIEFHARAERREAGIRVVERAQLTGLALVDRGAFLQSVAEIRRGGRGGRGGRLGSFRGRIPKGKLLDCRCSPGNCTKALFKKGSFDNLIGDEDEVLGVVGEYSQAIASKKRKSIRFWAGKDGDLEFAIDVPNNDRGKALMQTYDSVDIFARPVLDVGASDVKITGAIAEYNSARVRALTIGPTDAAAGWTPLRMLDGADDDLPEPRTYEVVSNETTSQRSRLWL